MYRAAALRLRLIAVACLILLVPACPFTDLSISIEDNKRLCPGDSVDVQIESAGDAWATLSAAPGIAFEVIDPSPHITVFEGRTYYRIRPNGLFGTGASIHGTGLRVRVTASEDALPGSRLVISTRRGDSEGNVTTTYKPDQYITVEDCGPEQPPQDPGQDPEFFQRAFVTPETVPCMSRNTVVIETEEDSDSRLDEIYWVHIGAPPGVLVLPTGNPNTKEFTGVAGAPDGMYFEVASEGGFPRTFRHEFTIETNDCTPQPRTVVFTVIDQPDVFVVPEVVGQPEVTILPGDPSAPGPGIRVCDSVVHNPQDAFIVQEFDNLSGPLALIVGGVAGDGAAALVDVATGGLVSTFLPHGQGNPQQYRGILWSDATVNPGPAYGIETLDLFSTRVNGGWANRGFKVQASDLNVLLRDSNGCAEYYIRTIPSTRQVQYSVPGQTTTVFFGFDFPLGLVPVSADYDNDYGGTNLWYILLVDPNDGNRTWLYVSDGSTMVPVHETGFGGVSVRLTERALVVAHEDSPRVSVFKRDADHVFAHALDIEDDSPVRSALVRQNGDDTVIAWANGTGIRTVVLDADCNVKMDKTSPPPEDMDQVTDVEWCGVNGLYGIGALGDQGRCFYSDDYVRDFDLDESARFFSFDTAR